MKTVAYWIVGIANKSQAPDVAFDLHDDSGAVLKSGSHALVAGEDIQRAARHAANDFAQRHGAASVHYDSDSTECFSGC
jgi:hypothetical protein